MCSDRLIVGIGSDHGDDQAGWLVVDALAPHVAPRSTARKAKAPLDLLDWLEGVRWLAICDACRGAGPVGCWHRWNWPADDLPFHHPAGSHSYGLLESLGLADRLGILPELVWIWGIEIGDALPDGVVAEAVAAAIPAVADDIRKTADETPQPPTTGNDADTRHQ